VVLHFEGDRHSRLRMVRAVKNRYGPTDEVGCFDLGEYGLIGLADPSGLFLSRHREPVPGTCVTVTLEGAKAAARRGFRRSLATRCSRYRAGVTSGLDASRIGMVLAVLQRRADVKVGKSDVYRGPQWAAYGSPSRPVDLAVALAIASSVAKPVPASGDHRGGRGRAGPAKVRQTFAGVPRPGGRGGADGLPPGDRPGRLGQRFKYRFRNEGHRGGGRARCPEGRLPGISPRA